MYLYFDPIVLIGSCQISLHLSIVSHQSKSHFRPVCTQNINSKGHIRISADLIVYKGTTSGIRIASISSEHSIKRSDLVSNLAHLTSQILTHRYFGFVVQDESSVDPHSWIPVPGNRSGTALGTPNHQSQKMEQFFQVQVFASLHQTGRHILSCFASNFGVIPAGCRQGDEEILQYW